MPLASPMRFLVMLAAVAAIAGCARQPALTDAQQDAKQVAEAEQYRAHARGDYRAPGPATDPWGPYIKEASARFDVPNQWIRQVMRVESNGEEFRGDTLTVSYKGAMGLMQVMPGTYDELKDRYALSDDPYDPYNNIIAGTAYLREMYDIYGSPGMLAAYNGGPKRLDDYLANFRPLPDETRHYVAKIAPYIEGIYPKVRSPAEDYAMNDLPTEIAPGLRYGGGIEPAAPHRTRYAVRGHATTQVAMAPDSRHKGHATEPRVQTASATARGSRVVGGTLDAKVKASPKLATAIPAATIQSKTKAPAHTGTACTTKPGAARKTCA